MPTRFDAITLAGRSDADALCDIENESPEDEDSDDLGLQGLMSQDEEDEDCDELADAVEE